MILYLTAAKENIETNIVYISLTIFIKLIKFNL